MYNAYASYPTGGSYLNPSTASSSTSYPKIRHTKHLNDSYQPSSPIYTNPSSPSPYSVSSNVRGNTHTSEIKYPEQPTGSHSNSTMEFASGSSGITLEGRVGSTAWQVQDTTTGLGMEDVKPIISGTKKSSDKAKALESTAWEVQTSEYESVGRLANGIAKRVIEIPGLGPERGELAAGDRIEIKLYEEVEREIELLRATLNELIDLIQPYAASPSQQRPPPPPAEIQAHSIRLTTLIQKSLESLKPFIHPTLSPYTPSLPQSIVSSSSKHNFIIQTRQKANTHSDTLTIERSIAEQEMELIRRRREALLSKATQVQTHMQMAGIAHEKEMRTSDSGGDVEVDIAEREGTGGRRMSRCHGCGIGATPGWRTGPDGPKSLCDSCGMHYAKLAKKKSSDDWNAGGGIELRYNSTEL